MRPLRFLCLAVLVALALPQVAGNPAHADDAAAAEHADADKDKNGYVDRGEFHQRMVEMFYLSDDDRDGYLSISEIGQVERADFDKADRDKDGKLGLYEYTEARRWEFGALDANSDGRITHEEARKYQE